MTNMNLNQMVRFDIDLTRIMFDRVYVAAENEGVTIQTFIEQAIREAVMESDKNVPNRNRDPDTYPHECHCGERFRLPMHLANHQRARHPDPYVEPEPSGPIQVETVQGENVGEPSMQSKILVNPEFKLGVDPKYIEVDERPKPLLDDVGLPYETDDPEITDLTGPSNDFSSDIPDFG